MPIINTGSLNPRQIAHLTKNQLNKRGGVSQERISGQNRYNSNNSGAVSGGAISGGAGNPNVQTSAKLAGAIPNTTRRRYVVS